LWSIAGIVAATMLFLSVKPRVPGLDVAADAYFQEAMTEAGLVYGTCRLINASVSVIKESTLQVEPAGVGVSLAVGQALDPIDDLTERLSTIVVMAIASLGVQKLAYEIGVSYSPTVLGFFVLILSFLLWYKNDGSVVFRRLVVRYTLFVIVLRFCLPISSLVNTFINHDYFEKEISAVRGELALDIAEMDSLREIKLPESRGFVDTIEKSAAFLKQKTENYRCALVAITGKVAEITKNLLRLTSLYIGVIVIQVIILPLLFLWLLVKTFYALLPPQK